ncbi:MAG: TolC family protein, partial [Bacteroidota bacterium]|nr:TolC family protein [Bacteroidota bacterium]
KNNVKSAEYAEEAGRLDISRVKNDISLNVVAAYLQLLLSMEQINIAKAQIGLSDSQLILTRKQVDAGSMPELNAAQLESQLATDSSTYITAVSNKEQNRLQLIALLNLDARQPFEVSIPDVDKIPLPRLSDLEPEELYKIATATQPLQQVDSLRIVSNEYSIKANRGAMYPTLSLFGQVNTRYSNAYQTANNVFGGFRSDTIAAAKVNGTDYPVVAQTPIYNTTLSKIPYWRQVGNVQLGEAIGLQLNVPIFNGRQLRTNYQRAKINLETAKLQLVLDNQTLQQNIYTARATAEASIQKFNANQKAAGYAEYANELSRKRYQIGILSTSDYLIAQNNLATARFNLASTRYDYIFRIKLLEYYKFGAVQL